MGVNVICRPSRYGFRASLRPPQFARTLSSQPRNGRGLEPRPVPLGQQLPQYLLIADQFLLFVDPVNLAEKRNFSHE